MLDWECIFNNLKEVRKYVGFINIILMSCLFLIFLKQNIPTLTNNAVLIAFEDIFLWIRDYFINLIPLKVIDSVYAILGAYYSFIFQWQIGILIILFEIFIYCYDKYLCGRKFPFDLEFRTVLWERIGCIKLIKSTFGSIYVLYKIIEFLSLGKNLNKFNGYEILIVIFLLLSICIIFLQMLFTVDEK